MKSQHHCYHDQHHQNIQTRTKTEKNKIQKLKHTHTICKNDFKNIHFQKKRKEGREIGRKEGKENYFGLFQIE